MATAALPVLSREYIWCPVMALGTAASELVTLPVEFAFLTTRPPAEPEEVDWKLGSWAEVDTPTARCLVGPGSGVELPKGSYYVWLRVTGASERPVRFVGPLKIT